MSTDLERDLRDALVTATPPTTLRVDGHAVLEQGARTVHRRRAARATAVVAAVAVVAVGASVVTADSGHRAAPPASTRPAGSTVSATLTVAGARYRVTLDPASTADSNLHYFSLDGAGRATALGGSSTARLGDSATWGQGSGNVVLGVLPVGQDGVGPFTPGVTNGDLTLVVAPLPGTGYRAFAAAPGATGLESFHGITWRSSAGRSRIVTDDKGAVFRLPSGDEVAVWATRDGGRWGWAGDRTLFTSAVAAREGVVTYSGEGATRASAVWAAEGLLPAGVTDVKAAVASGVRLVGDVQTAPLSGASYTAFAVQLDPEAGKTAALTTVTWTNPDGSAGKHVYPGS